MGNSGGGIVVLIQLAIMVLMIASIWKVFTKAGKPGWASIVPFYNLYVLLQITGKPGWWLILFLIPLVNIIMLFIVTFALAGCFGKGGGYALGMIFLPFIFYPMLAFGDAQYNG